MASKTTLSRWDKAHVWHPFTQQADWREDDDLLIVDRARGAVFTTVDGRRFLDGNASLWVNAHGHNHPALNRAVRRQLGRVAHATFLGLTHEPGIRLARELARLAPGGLSRVFYSDNGATAVEVALKMAYQYWVQSEGRPRSEFLALENSYHGDTLGAVSVGGIRLFHDKFKPLLFKSHFAPAPDCGPCPFRKKPWSGRLRSPAADVPATPRPGQPRAETGCRWECLGGAEKILKARRGKIAAAVVEPLVQGAAGMIVAPAGYLKGLERLCRAHGTLLIADEVATGFGRTGTLFAVEQEGVRPDLLCAAKSLTGGYLPLAATLATERIYRAFLGSYEDFKTFFHGHTYTANPLACAAALANLDLYRSTRLLQKLRPKIDALSAWLRSLHGRPHMGAVRQAGFMAGVELVNSAGRPFPPGDKMGQRICRAARRHGVWVRPLGDVIVLVPPLAISPADLKRLLAGVEAALMDVFPT